MVKVGQTHRRRDAGEARDGGATRNRAIGHGRGRAWARWKALAPARRTVVVAVPGVVCTVDGELGCGRRSSGAVGIGVTGCLGRRWCVLRAPGEVGSTIVRSVGCYGDRGHDGDIAGGVELSAKVGLGPRGRERPGEKGETIRGLTAELQGWLAGSGTRWRRRIRRRRWSEPEEGNGDVAAMQGFRGAVERWGGRGGRGGASELVGGARGGRRRLLWRTAATVVFGRVRESEGEEGRAGGE